MEKLRIIQTEYSCPDNDRIINLYNAPKKDRSLMPNSYEHAEIVYSIISKLPKEKTEIYFATPGNLEQAMKQVQPHLLVAPLGAIRNSEYLQQYKNKTLMLVAAGNEGMMGETELAEMDCTTAVGAIYPDGRIKSYSSRGKGHVRFVQAIPETFRYDLHGVPHERPKEGTSYTMPLQAVEFGFMYFAYQDKYNTFPTVREALNLSIFNVLDIGPVGFDLETGYGMFIWREGMALETPKNQADFDEIILTIGSKNLTIDGEHVTIDVEPFIEKGRTFVPIRFVAESMGRKVAWNGETRQVIIT